MVPQRALSRTALLPKTNTDTAWWGRDVYPRPTKNSMHQGEPAALAGFAKISG